MIIPFGKYISESVKTHQKKSQISINKQFQCFLLFYVLIISLQAFSQQNDDISGLSLEKLLDTEVSTESKRLEKLSETSSAICVITAQDIRRSGATNLPQLLRLVPGMEVASIDANKWAISARGFNNRFSNKLLVLIDGRSVYNHIFSGVFWETQELLLDDIQRIEVIRGPGGTLWGTNAVNGIINIISKNASETHGGLFSAHLGSIEKRGFQLRYGNAFMDNFHYRSYFTYTERDNFVFANGQQAKDDYKIGKAGFRLDANITTSDFLSVHGDAYIGTAGQMYEIKQSLDNPVEQSFHYNAEIAGANITASWEHIHSVNSECALHAYFDWLIRNDAVIDGEIFTYDIDFQQKFTLVRNTNIVWGVGFRHIRDDTDGKFSIEFCPPGWSGQLLSAFLQNEISLLNNKIILTVGTKIEHNPFTKVEYQPSLRVNYNIKKSHSLWAAVSRAIRIPSRADRDIRCVVDIREFGPPSIAPLNVMIKLNGNPNFSSEKLYAHEIGYRSSFLDNAFIDLSLFYHQYAKLRSFANTGIINATYDNLRVLEVPFYSKNDLSSDNYGVEFSIKYQPTQRLFMEFGYSYLNINLAHSQKQLDIFSLNIDDNSPTHQWLFKSSLDIFPNLEMDIIYRYVDELAALNVEDYCNLDIRACWKMTPQLEISLVGTNLLQDHHAEFSTPIGLNLPGHGFTLPTEVKRGYFIKMKWRF